MKLKSKIYFVTFFSVCSTFTSLSAAPVQAPDAQNSKEINLELDVNVSKVLHLADEAWKELLKEKIKEHIEKESKKMDEFAKLVAEANYERWKRKSKEKGMDSMEEMLKAYLQQTQGNEQNRD